MVFNTIFMVWAEAQNHKKKSHFEIKMIKKICLGVIGIEFFSKLTELRDFRRNVA